MSLFYMICFVIIAFIVVAFWRRKIENIDWRLKKIESLHAITGDTKPTKHMSRPHPCGCDDKYMRGNFWKKNKK